MYKIIDGNLISKNLLSEYKNKIFDLKKCGINITMADILVGNDEASKVYIENKKKKFDDIGIKFININLSSDISEKDLITKINELNNDNNINAIFVELPLPKHINESSIIDYISPSKDVDGFNINNIGALFLNKKGFFPCTAEGIIELLKRSNIEIEGKHCVIIGRSNIVGKPLSLLLLNENATVTICHSKTKNLKDICKTADILIVANGQKKSIDDTYVKEGVVVVDVGIHRDLIDGTKVISGDVDFDKVANHSSYITPVPGGVGPMTITMLIKHCLETVNE